MNITILEELHKVTTKIQKLEKSIINRGIRNHENFSTALPEISISINQSILCKYMQIFCVAMPNLKQVDYAHNSRGNFSKSLKVEDSLGHIVSSLRNKNNKE